MRNGQEAIHYLEAVAQHPPDLILLDLMLWGDPPALPGWLPAFDIYADGLRSS